MNSTGLRQTWLTIPKGILAVFLISLLVSACGKVSFEAHNPPLQTPVVDRLAAPPLPDSPTQADLGAQVYYQVCMACHGDRGQGLTEEWREVWEEDSNCWKSECHGNNHPPQGFSFPRTCCRALIGDGTLRNYKTALNLYIYVKDTMPWWNPGYLKDDEYWQLTAFLLRAHNALPPNVTLEPSNAGVFPIYLSSPIPGDKRQLILFLTAVLGLAAGVFVISNRLR